MTYRKSVGSHPHRACPSESWWVVGLTIGCLLGLACGLYILAWSPLPGVGNRALLVLFFTAIYALAVGLPIGLGATIGQRWWAVGSAANFPSSLRFRVAAGSLLICVASIGLQLAQDLIAYGHHGWVWALGKAFEGLDFVLMVMAVGGVVWAMLRWLRALRIETRWIATLLVLPVILLIAYLIFDQPHDGTTLPAEASPVLRNEVGDSGLDAARVSSRRVALIGFSGLDDQILRPLALGGEAPAFAELYRNGGYRPLKTLSSGLSPPIWASFATGVKPAAHGIHGSKKRRPLGTALDLGWIRRTPDGFGTVAILRGLEKMGWIETRPLSAVDRRAPALWQIGSEAGLRSSVVGWMHTWPAEPIGGTWISDRAFAAVSLQRSRASDASLPGSEPMSLPLGSVWASSERGICSPEPACLKLLHGLSTGQASLNSSSSADFYLQENQFYLDSLRRLSGISIQELTFFYSYLPDFVNHRMTPLELERVRAGIYETDTEKMVRRIYLAVDRTLQSLLEALGPDSSVFVVSDFGIDLLKEGKARRVSHAHGPDGVFFYRSGGRISNLHELLPGRVDIYDVAPTILALVGVDAPIEMTGRPMANLVRAELTAAAISPTFCCDAVSTWPVAPGRPRATTAPLQSLSPAPRLAPARLRWR